MHTRTDPPSWPKRRRRWTPSAERRPGRGKSLSCFFSLVEGRGWVCPRPHQLVRLELAGAAGSATSDTGVGIGRASAHRERPGVAAATTLATRCDVLVVHQSPAIGAFSALADFGGVLHGFTLDVGGASASNDTFDDLTPKRSIRRETNFATPLAGVFAGIGVDALRIDRTGRHVGGNTSHDSRAFDAQGAVLTLRTSRSDRAASHDEHGQAEDSGENPHRDVFHG